MENILEIKDCTKNFGNTVALNKVNLNVTRNKIHFIVGENGAGKSTLMKVVSGVYPHNEFSGKIFFDGKECYYKNINDSEKEGIVIIHQELALSPYLSVFENVFLGNEKKKGILIDWEKTREEASKILKIVGLELEDVDISVNKLGIAKQQLIEIAKALSKNSKLLILDEPTSSLNEEDSKNLLKLILKLKAKGLSIIMISHKLNEILEIADEITIIRDGETVERIDMAKDNIDANYIIKRMVGRELTALYPQHKKNIKNINVLELENITVNSNNIKNKNIVQSINLYLREGEIIGLAGIIGSGRTELMLSIFGNFLKEEVKGTIKFNNKIVNWKSPKEAISNGVIYVSEDRKDLGLVLIQTIRNNISYSSLRKNSKYGIIDLDVELNEVSALKEKLSIKSSGLDQKVGDLSGGNQQKVVLAKCFMAEPKLLIIDEPTRGIDIGAKNEIYKIMNKFVEDGNSIIMISSDLQELLGMTNRIYIMDKGKIKGEILTADATQEKIMEIALA